MQLILCVFFSRVEIDMKEYVWEVSEEVNMPTKIVDYSDAFTIEGFGELEIVLD